MRCVVTGGAGFIGSNLVDALTARGDRVSVIDNLSTGRTSNLDWARERGAELHVVDIRDEPELRAVFVSAQPELVFHLAAQVGVPSSQEDPLTDAAANVLGTIAVLECARAVGAVRVVNSSTGGGLYGDVEVLPTPETHPPAPIAPYGEGKRAAEGYCDLYGRIYGLSTVSLRYGNVYGPRQEAHGEAGVVAIFCRCVLEGRRPTIYGDGRQTRDWVEVSDVVRANLLAGDSELSGPLNIGWGQETSVLELLDGLLAASGRSLAEPQFASQRSGEVRRSSLDSTLAKRELGWQPEVGLEEGLRRLLGALGR